MRLKTGRKTNFISLIRQEKERKKKEKSKNRSEKKNESAAFSWYFVKRKMAMDPKFINF